MENRELDGLKKTVTDAIAKFRSENERYGYSHIQVSAFFEKLMSTVEAYGTAHAYETKSQGADNRGLFEAEYRQRAERAVKAINDEKFMQVFKGYSTVQVDDYLDRQISEIRKHGSYSMINSSIDYESAADAGFRNELRGYDVREVDIILDKIANLYRELNEIKNKYK